MIKPETTLHGPAVGETLGACALCLYTKQAGGRKGLD